MSRTRRARITFETDMPGEDDNGRTLHRLWTERREVGWRVTAERIARATATHPTRHACTLTRVTAGERDGVPIAVVRLAIDVETRDGEDPETKARRVLDLPHGGPRHARRVPGEGVFGRDGRLQAIRSPKVIGPLPEGWLTDGGARSVTDYSRYLGSYGQGGGGLSGWQINNGSWLLLPLRSSDGWITLTRETVDAAPGRQQLSIEVDQRILGVHPDQLADFPPWEHRYAGHDKIEDMPSWKDLRLRIRRFARDADGFVMELGDTGETWRFEMSAQLPRPIYAGTKEERELYEGEDVGASFLLTHDCYIDV